MLTGLIRDLEVVQERVPAGDRTLVDEGGAVRPVRSLLEEAVPVLAEHRVSSISNVDLIMKRVLQYW